MITSNESIKNSKSRLLRLSSEDKATGTNGRFSIDILSSGGLIDNVKGYIVHSIQSANVFDNVPTYANVFTVIKTTGAITYDITIPNSYYYVDDLVPILTSTISAAIADTVVVTKTGTAPIQKLTFTFAGDEYTIQASSTIASRLGITADLTCPDGVATTSQSVYNLIGETELYIHSRDLAPNNLIEGSGSFSVVDKLDLNQPYGSMCYSTFNTDSTHFKKYFPFESLKTLRTVRITVRNRTGAILTLPDNYNLSIMLMVFYK
jgi:hypothetical protein